MRALALLLLLPSASWGMGRMPPAKVREFYSKNREFKVVVVPSSSSMRAQGAGPELEASEQASRAQERVAAPADLAEQLPAGEKPKAFVYRRNLVGGEYERLSSFELQNTRAPGWCFVADDGRALVTQGEWYRAKGLYDLAVYRLPQGTFVSGLDTPELFGDAVAKTWASTEFGPWAESAVFKFEWREGQVERLVAWTDWGQRLSVNLGNGYPEVHWEDSRLRPEFLTEKEAWELFDGAKDSRGKSRLLGWMRVYGSPESLPRLRRLVEAWEKETGWRALQAYAGAGKRQAVPYLLELFRSGRREMRQSAAGDLGSIYWQEWADKKVVFPPEPGVVEAYRNAILSDPDDDLRLGLIGSFCHYFYPRLPDTGAFLLKAAETEPNAKVRAEMKHWGEHMNTMYKMDAENRLRQRQP